MPIDRVYVLTCETPDNGNGNEILDRPLCFKNPMDAIRFVCNFEDEGIINITDIHFFEYSDYGQWMIVATRCEEEDYADFSIVETDLL